MCITNILDITHYFFLNAYSGLVTKVMALIRNIFILGKEDNKKLKSNIFLILFIIVYIILAIITFKNIYSILPFVAAIIYMIAVWNGNELQIKKIAFLCYFFWLVYNISVFSVMGIISNIVALISTYIAYFNFLIKPLLDMGVDAFWINNDDLSKEFIYDGIDAQGNKYTFSSSQIIPYKNYICLSLFKYDILEKNNIVCKQYTIYPLNVRDGSLYLYDTLFKSDKIN